MNDEATNGEEAPDDAPEESEGFKKGQEAKGRINAILAEGEWLKKNAPSVCFVFACAPIPRVYAGISGGLDSMTQIGLLEVAKELIRKPVVTAIQVANQSSLVAPTGAPIPLSRSQR